MARQEILSDLRNIAINNKNKDYILVGQDPYKSCVPLEELKSYKLVYGSSQKVTSGSKPQSEVKIFEHDKDTIPLSGD